MTCFSCGSANFGDDCSCSATFTSAIDVDFCSSLIGSLVCVVDEARDLFTQLGARPYAIFLVWTRWSGGVRGEGTEQVVCRRELLPVPKVKSVDALQTVVEQIGALEDGYVKISELSLRYTEDDLMGVTGGVACANNELPPDVSFYWEIQIQDAAGCPIRRRMATKSPPNRDPLNMQWTITLSRQSEDRTRAGEPQ